MERGATNVELRYHYSQKKKPMSIRAKNILFRADSSSKIGTGHIMRDLVLAERFKDANIIFATQALPGNINSKIEEKGYAIELLDTNDIEALDSLIKKRNISKVVIDHYAIDYAFEEELKIRNAGLKIMVVADCYERHCCDILLNHNIYADADRYTDLVPRYCKLQCGSKYTLLREEFIKAKNIQKNRDRKRTVFIAMGGLDHSNINIDILEVLKSFENIRVILVTTTANKNIENLQKYCNNKQWIELHINSNKIASLMQRSDFSIVTPSVTLNEVYFMELPFIAIKTAENQNEMYEFLKNKYLVLSKFNKSKLKTQISKILKKIGEIK